MKRLSIFRRILLCMFCVCLLTAGLTLVAYFFTGAPVFAVRIAEEMTPRANSIARLAERYQTGQISFDSFIDLSLREQKNSRVFIYDSECNLVAYTNDSPGGAPGRKEKGGDKPENDGLSQSDSMADIARSVISTGEQVVQSRWRAKTGITVAVPISDNVGRITGVVVMNRPLEQVSIALRQLTSALLISCIVVSALLILPVYLMTKRITMPLHRMTDIAIAMASGDFHVRAEERGGDEVAQLGHALNYLSSRLNANIQDLVLAKDRLHMILNGLQEGVIALDSRGETLYCNPASMTLLGLADMDEVQKYIAPLRSMLEMAQSEGTTQTCLRKDGERTLYFTAARSQDTAEEAPGVILVVRDITAAERLEQTRRDYVANVSHELRTPIASIRSLAETLNDGLCKSEEDRSRYYGYILRESMRLSRLINDLLELSRLQSGAVALEKQPFAICALLEEVAEKKRIDADYSGIAIRVPAGVPQDTETFSNRDRIEQVLIALIDNAIKFSSDDGVITLNTTDLGAYVEVSVANTGHIDEKALPHLFERFYKADTAHSDSGTGLGLAIAQEILTLLGESIVAENANGCAVFRFTVHKACAVAAAEGEA